VSDTLRIKIIHGSDFFDLLTQLGDIKRMRKERPVFPLTLRHDKEEGGSEFAEVGVHVNGLIAEDGSGVSWIFLGHIDRSSIEKEWLATLLTNDGWFNSTIHGIYHTREYSGWIKPGPLLYNP
jgi:hypothetical protein